MSFLLQNYPDFLRAACLLFPLVLCIILSFSRDSNPKSYSQEVEDQAKLLSGQMKFYKFFKKANEYLEVNNFVEFHSMFPDLCQEDYSFLQIIQFLEDKALRLVLNYENFMSHHPNQYEKLINYLSITDLNISFLTVASNFQSHQLSLTCRYLGDAIKGAELSLWERFVKTLQQADSCI